MRDLRFASRRAISVFWIPGEIWFAGLHLAVEFSWLTFRTPFGPSHCLMAGPSSDLWKWHRRLGHLSFDLLSRLSSLGLIRGLPKLKFEKDLVCHPCRHGKMIAASHPPVN